MQQKQTRSSTGAQRMESSQIDRSFSRSRDWVKRVMSSVLALFGLYTILPQMISSKLQRERTVPLVEFLYPVFTCMPGESCRRSLLLCLRVMSFECQLTPLFVDSAFAVHSASSPSPTSSPPTDLGKCRVMCVMNSEDED